MGLISKVVKDNTDINDQVIFANSLIAAKGGTKAYLAATLTSTTPEIREFFSSKLTKDIIGHTALVELGLKKGWIDPSLTPKEALLCEVEKSKCLFESDF